MSLSIACSITFAGRMSHSQQRRPYSAIYFVRATVGWLDLDCDALKGLAARIRVVLNLIHRQADANDRANYIEIAQRLFPCALEVVAARVVVADEIDDGRLSRLGAASIEHLGNIVLQRQKRNSLLINWRSSDQAQVRLSDA
jgi:hypothetical protein